MKIEMLETVEDTHKFFDGPANREETKFDTRTFLKGQVYDGENIAGDWDRRAAGLVALGYAKGV